MKKNKPVMVDLGKFGKYEVSVFIMDWKDVRGIDWYNGYISFGDEIVVDDAEYAFMIHYDFIKKELNKDDVGFATINFARSSCLGLPKDKRWDAMIDVGKEINRTFIKWVEKNPDKIEICKQELYCKQKIELDRLISLKQNEVDILNKDIKKHHKIMKNIESKMKGK